MKRNIPYEDIPEEEEEERIEINRKYKASMILIAVFGFLSIAVAFVGSMSITNSNVSFNARVVTPAVTLKSKGVGAMPKLPSYATAVAPVATTGAKFTTNRVGYDILSYFGTKPSSVLKYKILEDFIGVVEPYANMMINLVSVDPSADTSSYKYTICPVSDSDNCITNSIKDSFMYECSPGETYAATVTTENDEVLAAGSLMCIYVRREMRSLTDEDLDASIEAMWKMWDLEQEDGEELYGEDFLNYAKLLEYHYFNAAWRDADHVHEGLGFLPQHLKMDLYFSKSLTAINPSLSMFYWDFTIENATGIDVWDSPMFTNRTFGSLTLPTDRYRGWSYANDKIEDAAIPDSHWKSFKTDMNTKYPDLMFGYGYMRAPWNLNPSEYLTRFTSVDKYLPTCESHYELANTSSYADYLKLAPYDVHASTHGVIGGVFGCDMFDELVEAGLLIDEQAKLDLCKNWVFYLKEFNRDDYITPYASCTATTEDGTSTSEADDQDCGFSCESTATFFFITTLKDILNMDYTTVDEDSLTNQDWVTWVNFVCEGNGYKIFGGDHLESASPADPSFWPIHPTLERLTQAKFMAGGFTDTTWPTNATTDYVCDKQRCYDSELGFGTWSTCCYGHYEFDQLMDADNGDRYTGVGPTNYEIMSWNDASSTEYAMDYIYDSFTWDHCADVGYDIETMLEDQSAR